MKKKQMRVLALRPTQFAVGIFEVRAKAHELKKMSPKKLRKALKAKTVPVVISSLGHYYITDHHHHLFACLLAGVERVPVMIKEDIRKRAAPLGFGRFWRHMSQHGNAYLYDQFGKGPHSAVYLPEDVRGMADDPYRSLAWAVREAGGYENCEQNFSEFMWADFFRASKLLDREGREGFKEATERGVRLAKSKAATKLPGYTG